MLYFSSEVRSAVRSLDGKRYVSGDMSERVARIYRRRRPEYWYGPAWLPEFWLTVVLSVGMAVSVWRDQRSLRQTA